MITPKKPYIAVDFDGVIHSYSQGWRDGTIYDPPIEGAKEALKALGKRFNVVIFTIRLSKVTHKDDLEKQQSMIEVWFKKYGFIRGIHYHEMTAIKPRAKIYIDDKGYRFTDWGKTLREIKKLIG